MYKRDFLARTAALIGMGLAPSAFAQPESGAHPTPDEIMRATNGAPLFPSGPLHANRVAEHFASTPQLTGPFGFQLTGQDRSHELASLTGKVRLISLWAENFWPCLHELNELAELQTLYGDEHFEIMAILTQSPKKLDYDAASNLLSEIQAENLTLWIEPEGRNEVARALSTMIGTYPDGHPMAPWPITNLMPCTLIVDEAGQILGRTLGGHNVLKKHAVRSRWKTPLPVALTGELPERSPTVWSSKDADTFILALKDGALENLPVLT